MLGVEYFNSYLNGKNVIVITDHLALITALKASERSKISQSRLTRWIDRLVTLDITFSAGNKMGLIEYMSQNPVKLAILPSAFDEEFVVASINLFIGVVENFDNIILNNLANQN